MSFLSKQKAIKRTVNRKEEVIRYAALLTVCGGRKMLTTMTGFHRYLGDLDVRPPRVVANSWTVLAHGRDH